MSLQVCSILGIVFAVIATILAWIFILPEKKVRTLNKFWYTVHRILNLKDLLVEKILKTLYVLNTAFCIFGGFFMIFYVLDLGFYSRWMGYIGFIVMILGPIIVRIVYELLVSYFILIKNVQDLRNKFCDDGNREEYNSKKSDPAYVPNYIFCPNCGQRYDSNSGPCPYCSSNGMQQDFQQQYNTQPGTYFNNYQQ